VYQQYCHFRQAGRQAGRLGGGVNQPESAQPIRFHSSWSFLDVGVLVGYRILPVVGCMVRYAVRKRRGKRRGNVLAIDGWLVGR